MTEEQKPQTTPPPAVGKPPMSWENRVRTLSMKNLRGECNRISKNPETKLSGALADALLITVFKTHNKGNDPYGLERPKEKNYDIWKSFKTEVK